MLFKRILKLKHAEQESCFLWGPRQMGKSTYLKETFPSSKRYDLLDPAIFQKLNADPSRLAEEILADPESQKHPIILDEVQKIPILLDEIQKLIVDKNWRFILCGSSARKLKRGGGNLLGGRALRYELFPFVSREIPDFNLLRALNNGLIPRHYLSTHAPDLLAGYVGEYLKEEIVAEALVRNIQSFSRFLEAAAFTNGEIIIYKNVASDCGVNAATVKEYFQILQDTLIGHLIEPFQLRPKRRVIQAPKFYFFELGIVNFLLKRRNIETGSELFGRVFEHFILQELMAHRHYSRLDYPLHYWRTASGLEVDFILGKAEVAVEVKGVQQVQSKHLKGIKAFCEEYKTKQAIVVSLDSSPRMIGNILVLPWQEFLDRLWGGKLIVSHLDNI